MTKEKEDPNLSIDEWLEKNATKDNLIVGFLIVPEKYTTCFGQTRKVEDPPFHLRKVGSEKWELYDPNNPQPKVVPIKKILCA